MKKKPYTGSPLLSTGPPKGWESEALPNWLVGDESFISLIGKVSWHRRTAKWVAKPHGFSNERINWMGFRLYGPHIFLKAREAMRFVEDYHKIKKRNAKWCNLPK